ncbi:hypothetical protein [Leptospira yasudae]|nr:hypothetical protein [Leptospira yasudae]
MNSDSLFSEIKVSLHEKWTDSPFVFVAKNVAASFERIDKFYKTSDHSSE